MIKDSAACLSKNVEKVSFDLIDFDSTVSEKGAAYSVSTVLFEFCYNKLLSLNGSNNIGQTNLQTFISEKNSNIPVETANVKYHSLLNEQADSKETLKTILDKLHQDFKIGRELKHLVVVGDGKTYDLLVKLKLELKDDLNAGLKELIELFHHGAVGAAVMQATNFDKTHYFLMQMWEAFYLQQISAILKYAEENDLNDQSEENYIKKVSFVLQNQKLNHDEKIQQHLDLMSHFSLQFRNLCCRKQIAWSKEQYTPISDLQQFISLPRAIVDHDGLPYKGDKSKTVGICHSRYPDALENKLHFKPDCVIIDGMFVLNCKPLKYSNRLFADFLVSLFNRWIIPYIQLNTKEIHIVFDDQSPQLSPKDIERKRRDEKAETTAKILISETTKIPSDWQAFLHNRENKKQLVQLVSEKFLHFAKIALNSGQSFVIGGGFENASITKVVEKKNTEKIATNLETNISEGDSRVWFHANNSQCKNILIYSLDNDTYHIGLPIMQKCSDKNIAVQLSYKNDLIFFSMNRSIRCLESDPDLHSIEKDDLPLIIQNLFILTGCDYVSFFKDHEFITTSLVENNVIGKLSLTNSDDISSFLSFIRLIGCEYWRKCSSAFLREKLETPEQLYRTVYSSNLSPKENHIAWISKIREALYSRVPSEEFYLPSFDALFLHWKRSYWVSRVWVQAYCENVQYPSLTYFGWKLEIDGQLDVIWDSPENLQKVCNTEETEENTAETVASTQELYNSESDASDFGDDTMDGSVFFELQNVDDDDLENIIFNFQYRHLA
ncbi:unnamed protein product [Mytilus coruscus]|uniref:Uncharacterized protein n=1 Tax=Mytilus coruscus TaxID=42192 RepID=A0A6J8A3J9_MYTCO|nr:unnamed protein product [Mytilus coruscus]